MNGDEVVIIGVVWNPCVVIVVVRRREMSVNVFIVADRKSVV